MAAKFGCGKRWVGKVVLCLCFLLVLLVPLTCAGRATVSTAAATSTGSGSGSSSQKLEVQKHLKNLNRPPVKSIKSPDGDIIDCVHVSHQPAFDHPDLKSHKIQITPNSHPEGRTFGESKVSSNSKPITQLWHQNGRCPEGSIPIRRTRKDDILRASSIQKFGKKNQRSFPQPRSAKPLPDLITQSGHQHAIVYVEGDKYYGAKATINVWDPKIQQPNEFSLSQMWILGGSFGQDLNSIEAGWQVSPDLYGDNNTRLFTYWTSDAYQATGCYNLLCSGFIQINSDIALGASIYPLSKYGSSQYDISILVWKDPKEGNWWMQFGNDHVLGYWPAPLFSYLTDSASMIEWGGEVVNSQSDGQHTSTQMGSGHFPEEGFGKASYFKNIQTVDGDNKLRPPKDLGIYTEQGNCYNVNTGTAGDWGNYFYYGGPGRNPNCP
ncbi:protein neprosin-like isoform X1 [Gastrolobium bilobum]|uniref:protein neprosin-like isoform X1 n=1 Tax=Gastrolobium bilobum TaxID=150636 RepID=UPI002AB2D043|nr:protein neprosin-like isoform X1 [Gastrolobium bilobum]